MDPHLDWFCFDSTTGIKHAAHSAAATPFGACDKYMRRKEEGAFAVAPINDSGLFVGELQTQTLEQEEA